MIFKELILLSRQLYLLSVESSSEFSGINSSLSKRIMILEEFSNSDSVSLNHVHDFCHQSINSLGSREIDINWLVSRLGSGIRLIDFVFKDRAIIQEWKILNISKLGSINLDNRGQLSIRNLYSKKSDSLLELLWRDLEMVVSILILEETLCIKSLSVDKEHELFLNLGNILGINIICLLLSIE